MSAKVGWTRVAFGEVVRLVRERSSDPDGDGLSRYVGLEHIDPGDLRVQRCGNVSDGTTFTNVFHAGQVLFGKRRAYQRKVARADFDGVCSGDIYVFEARSEQLLPELLPFVCQSDRFFEHAIETSAGSLSPRTNWNSLAKFEFSLPPIAEQRRIVRLLLSSLEAAEAYRILADASHVVTHALEYRLLVGKSAGTPGRGIEGVSLPTGWRWVPASSLCTAPVTSGITPAGGEVDSDPDCPFIKVGNLTFDGSLQLDDMATLNRAAFAGTSSLHVTVGDVLTNIVGPPLGKVSVVPPSLPRALINQAIVRFRPPDPHTGVWLRAYLMSAWAKEWLFVRSKKTSGQRNINSTTCAALPVPMPPRAELESLVARLMFARVREEEARIRALQSRTFLRMVVSQALTQ